ncbi:hypothetical protein ACFC06_27170 [Nocardia sp. NPDC056064]|uniref:hypothetical protein n=1 Tax=Nocardia sp. NPDC056064 TaxID=3345701 RepID=UPI0035E14918
MTSDRQSDRRGHHPDGFAEFTEELRLLAEVLLARVEPVLRRTAADGQADLGGCAWCPVCAAAALVRGDHHDVVAALADHGTAMVTVLREALAGVPVDPLLPPEWMDHAAGHPQPGRPPAGNDPAATPASRPTAPDTHATTTTASGPRAHATSASGPGAHATTASGPSAHATTAPGPRAHATPTASGPGAHAEAAASAEHDDRAGAAQTERSRPRWGARKDPQTPRPRRVDEYPATRGQGAPTRTPPVPPISPDSGPIPAAAPTADPGNPRGTGDRRKPTRDSRARYVDIPVTIRG